MDEANIGAVILDLRKRRGMTQEQLAAHAAELGDTAGAVDKLQAVVRELRGRDGAGPSPVGRCSPVRRSLLPVSGPDAAKRPADRPKISTAAGGPAVRGNPPSAFP